MTDRRTAATAIQEVIATSRTTVADVEKAAGLHVGELQSFLDGDDIMPSSLIAAGGLFGVSPRSLFPEVAHD